MGFLAVGVMGRLVEWEGGGRLGCGFGRGVGALRVCSYM